MSTSEKINAEMVQESSSKGRFALSGLPLSPLLEALQDILNGAKSYRLWTYMANAEIKRRYRRTILGPFWTTLSLAIFIFTMSVLFSSLWKTHIPSFLPFFASGFICWVFVSTIIIESCNIFVSAEGMLKQIPLPFSIFSYLVVYRNLIVMAHHSVVYLIVLLYLNIPVNMSSLLFIPGLMLICLTGLSVSLILGLLCSRYRDIQQVINSLLQISMFVTPIFWPPSQLTGRKAVVFIDSNPLYHYVNIVRMPLLGQSPEPKSWAITIGITIFTAILALFIFSKYRKKLIFWL